MTFLLPQIQPKPRMFFTLALIWNGTQRYYGT